MKENGEKLDPIPPSDPEENSDMGAGLRKPALKPQEPESSVEPVSTSAETVVLSAGLQVQQKIGARYEVRRLLGQGGMGAVYQVYDTALEREAALKVIRPEIAESPEFLERFKREIQLSSIVTHKNVLRVYDLGEADGFKFLTMQYVSGESLSSLLRRERQLPLPRLIKLFTQICEGLSAAHEQDVLHRDLKPENILVDSEDRAYLTDFGLAKSTQHSSMTQAGQVMGTPDYMSPEQVKSEPVDQRSDIYSLGAVLYEMVAGRVPFTGNSVYEVMIQRVQKPPRDARELNPNTPEFLANIVTRCMAIDKEARYYSVDELLEELKRGAETLGTAEEAAFQEGQKAAAVAAGSGVIGAPSAPIASPSAVDWIRQAPVSRKYRYLLGSAALVLMIVVGWWLYQIMTRSEATLPSSEVLALGILPFKNDSGDASLEWLSDGFAEMLRSEIGQSSDLRIVSPQRLAEILRDLKISPQTSLHQGTLRRIAEYCNADQLIRGSYLQLGREIQLEAAMESPNEQNSTPLGTSTSEDLVKEAVSALASQVRENLRLTTAQNETLENQSYLPTADSLQALKAYYEGLRADRAGDSSTAVGRYEEAVDADPEFSLALARLGLAYTGLGLDSQAKSVAQQAEELSEKLSEIEGHWVRAIVSQASGGLESQIEAFEALASLTPLDPEVNVALGDLYESNAEFELAREHYARVRDADPRNMKIFLASGRVEIKKGSSESSLEFLNQALSLAVQANDQQIKADTMQALGIAYKLLDRRDDALRHYEDALELRRKVGDQRGVAASLSEIAQIYELMGDLEASHSKYDESLAVFRVSGDRQGAAIALMNLGIVAEAQGDVEEALQYAQEALQVQSELGDEENQSLSLNNIGSLYFAQNQYESAIVYFEQALELREKHQLHGEVADSHHNLGETYHRLGQNENALTQFQKAYDLRQQSDDRRGAALETYGMASVLLAQGRYGSAVTSLEESVSRLREMEGEDAFLAEVLAAYGDSLGQVGRMEEAGPVLQESLELSRQLDSSTLISRSLTYQGKNAHRSGNLDQGRTLVRQALKAAKASGDLYEELIAAVFLARLDLEENGGELASRLRGLTEQTVNAGFRQLEAECTVYSASVLVESKKLTEAVSELELLLSEKENLLPKDLQARVHILLARARQGLAETEVARSHFARARALFEEIERDTSGGRFLQRADIQPMYQQAIKALGG